MSNKLKLAGFYLMILLLVTSIIISGYMCTRDLGFMFFTVLLLFSSMFIIPAYDTSFLTTVYSEFRITKITPVCDTIEKEPEFRIEQRTKSLLCKEDDWIRLTTKNNLEDAQAILENLKKGMKMGCSTKKEVIE